MYNLLPKILKTKKWIIIYFLLEFVSLLLVFRYHPYFYSMNTVRDVLLIISIILVIPLFFINIYFINKLGGDNHVFKYLILVFSILFVLLSITAEVLNVLNFSNYVFSQTYIHLPTFHLHSFLQFVFFLLVIKKMAELTEKKVSRSGALNLLVVFCLLLIIFSFFLEYPSMIIREYKIYRYWSFVDRDIKREEVRDLGNFYQLTDFIAENTEENSAIILPRQSSNYSMISNQPLMRYFLYPRDLVAEDLSTLYINSNYNDRPIYVILYKDEILNDTVFPNKIIKAKKIVILDKNGSQYLISDVNYEPGRTVANDFLVGLIEIK